MVKADYYSITVLFFKEFFLMKSVKGIFSLAIAVLFSLGFTLTAFTSGASGAGLADSLTQAAGAVVDSATDSAVATAKEKAGEAIANAMGEEAGDEAVIEETDETDEAISEMADDDGTDDDATDDDATAEESEEE